jgi:hypothetical protein
VWRSIGFYALGGLVLGLGGCDIVFRLDDIRACPTCRDGGTSDAGGDSLLVGDRDGDGVLDVMDNCPDVANAEQYNHDQDSTGDACDTCPHLSLSSADIDSDGDGLGNGCDPRINTPGDSRQLFVGFYSAADISGWGQLPPGKWTVAGGGVLRLADNTASDATIEIPRTFDDVFVQISMRGAGVAAGSLPHSFTISAARSGLVKHDCRISAPTNGGPKELIYDDPAMAITGAWGGQLTETNPMTFMLHGRHMVCAVGGSAPETHDVVDFAQIPHVGLVGFVAEVVAVDIDYVFIATPGT